MANEHVLETGRIEHALDQLVPARDAKLEHVTLAKHSIVSCGAHMEDVTPKGQVEVRTEI